MEWEPDEQAWHSYINFELRYKELDRARVIYERYILLLISFCVTNVLYENIAFILRRSIKNKSLVCILLEILSI